MTLTPSSSVDTVTKIEFGDSLGLLQELLDLELRVQLFFRGTFGAATIQGRLTRVETLPPDHSAVNVLLDDRQSLMLDPIDTWVLLVEDPCEDRRWLEFHLPSGVVAIVERI